MDQSPLSSDHISKCAPAPASACPPPPAEAKRKSPAASSTYLIDDQPWRVRDIPENLRPREEMERVGADNVSEAVLLAIILRGGTRGRNVVEIARRLLKRYGSLTALAECSAAELMRAERGIGRVKAQVIVAALELAKRLNRESLPKRYRIASAEDVARLLRDRAKVLQHEVFWVLHLDAKNNLKGEPLEVTQGVLTASLVDTRAIFREAVRRSTAATVLAHNHPSGDPSPSTEDIRVTQQMVAAGKIVDIHVLDHVILGRADAVGSRDYFSIREAGLVNFGG